MKTLYLFCIFFLLLGCASTPKMPSAAARVPLAPFQVKPVAEVYGVRLDLVKNRDSGFDSAKMVSSSSARFSSDYGWIAVDFGNGLIVDTRNNLCVDLVRLYAIPEPFRIESVENNVTHTQVTFQRDSKEFTRLGNDNALPDVNVVYDEGEIQLGFPGDYHPSIMSDEEGVVFDSKSNLGMGKTSLKIVSEKKVSLPGLLTSNDYWLKNDSTVILGEKFTAKKNPENTEIVIQINGILSELNNAMHFVRTADGCVFNDFENNLYVVKKEGPKITVLKNGELKRTLTITVPEKK